MSFYAKSTIKKLEKLEQSEDEIELETDNGLRRRFNIDLNLSNNDSVITIKNIIIIEKNNDWVKKFGIV